MTGINHAPAFVHYLPIGTTFVSLLFLIVLLRRAKHRSWPPHLNWWAIGVFFYGVGTTFESTITLMGNSPELTRWWYWAGAIMGGYPLATGSVYLLFKNRWIANVLTVASFFVVVVASVAIFMTPLVHEAVDPVRPSGKVLEWQWVRLLTPIINIYAVVFLIGGAIHSSLKFGLAFFDRNSSQAIEADAEFAQMTKSELRYRAWGTGLIAFGALLPGIGGSLTKTNDLPEALYVGELLGIILIWVGYELCTRKRSDTSRLQR
jgi:hypothetical protein